MNERETVFNICAQIQSNVRQMEEAFAAILEQRDKLRTDLARCETENGFLRGDLNEDFSYVLGEGHELSEPRGEFDAAGRAVVRRNCVHCGFEETRLDNTDEPLIEYDGELEEKCQGHIVNQPE